MTTLKPIETHYQGYRFRSRLEARWAVFFDALGVKWEYEKEGYELSDGTWYLPDFWLPKWGKWVEIKPDYPTRLEQAKCRRLTEATGKDSIILWGSPWLARYEKDGERYYDASYRGMFCDDSIASGEHFIFAECRRCPAINVLYVGNGQSLSFPETDKEMKPFPECDYHGYGSVEPCCGTDRWPLEYTDRMIAAYTAARSARFEHGARG